MIAQRSCFLLESTWASLTSERLPHGTCQMAVPTDLSQPRTLLCSSQRSLLLLYYLPEVKFTQENSLSCVISGGAAKITGLIYHTTVTRLMRTLQRDCADWHVILGVTGVLRGSQTTIIKRNIVSQGTEECCMPWKVLQTLK